MGFWTSPIRPFFVEVISGKINEACILMAIRAIFRNPPQTTLIPPVGRGVLIPDPPPPQPGFFEERSRFFNHKGFLAFFSLASLAYLPNQNFYPPLGGGGVALEGYKSNFHAGLARTGVAVWEGNIPPKK